MGTSVALYAETPAEARNSEAYETGRTVGTIAFWGLGLFAVLVVRWFWLRSEAKRKNDARLDSNGRP